MSPRTEEFLQQAHERLADALSERGEYAKTHGGTWTLFSQVFVAPGEFDQALSAMARRAKDAREQGDYEAAPPTPEESADFVEGAAEFIGAIDRLLATAG